MAGQNYFDQFDDPAVSKRRQQKETETGQQETIRGQTIQSNAATLPYQAPKAAVDLQNAQTQARFSKLEQSQKLRNNFEALKPVRDYVDSMPQLASALGTAPNSAGDQMLLYAAAKLADPGSVVRESEQASWAQTQPIVQQLQARFGKEVFNGGQFTDRQRRIIRAELIRMAKTKRTAYERERRNYERTAQKYGLDPEDVLGEHAGKSFLDDMRAYDARMRGEGGTSRKPVQRDVFAGEPEGMDVTPEDIQAYRYTPDQEKALVDLMKAPDFTPEAYADTATKFALDNGTIKPEMAEPFRLDALGRVADVAKMPPEERAAAKFQIDYGPADIEATKNAGLIAGIEQAFKNAPESGAQLIKGLAAVPVDVARSALEGERVGTTETLTDLGGEVASYPFTGEAGPTMQATGEVLEERYGSGTGLKRTAITDPIGLAGDVSSIATTGGTLAAKGPGMVGKLGERAAAFGKAVDPLALGVKAVTEGAPALYDAAKARAPGFTQGLGRLPSEVLGLPSGVGGAALREGAAAGRSAGRAGAPTPQSEAFTSAMRDPANTAEDAVNLARQSLDNLRQQASQQYTAAMQQFGQNPVPLDVNNVKMALARVRPKNYDAMLDAPRRPSDHVAWEQMNATVDHYIDKAQADPSLLEPLQMDQFKQDLYDIGSKIGGAYDRDAARIAGKAYNAVKQELVKHDPVYAETMANYERAAKEVQRLEQTFSLNAARGKEPNIEQATRRLQSVMRNNAYTNYGQRANMAERLAELDPTGTLMPSLGGQTASTWTPRGLQGAVGSGATALGFGGAFVGGMPITGPLLAAAPLFSPRAMGELAFGAGKAVGTMERVAGGATKYLLDKYRENQPAALAISQAGESAKAIEQEKRDEMLRKYGVPVTPLDYDVLSKYAGR